MILNKDVLIDGVKIHYSLSGDNKNHLLLFLHGWPGLEFIDSDLLIELSKHFYVIAPDHPGLLRSEPLNEYTNIVDQYSEIVYKIIKNESLNYKKFFVIGQSFGAIIAGSFTNKYPKNVKALIFTDAQMGYQRNDFLRKFIFKNGEKIIRFYIMSPNKIKKHGLKNFFGIQSEWEKNINNKLLMDRINMTKSVCNLFRNSIKEEHNLLMRDYGKLPIIMLWGDRDGKEFNKSGYSRPEDAFKFFTQLKEQDKNVIFKIIKGGHTILYKNPQYVISEIINILKSINLF